MVSLYVGNIPFDATDEELRRLFAPFGEVLRVALITEEETGRPRGFAFVDMADADAARAAIEALHGVECRGRALTVSDAQPPPKNETVAPCVQPPA